MWREPSDLTIYANKSILKALREAVPSHYINYGFGSGVMFIDTDMQFSIKPIEKDILTDIRGKKVYLASPYTNKFRHRERWNVEAVTFIANYMISEGILVNSPITHGDAIYETSLRTGNKLPKDFKFWKEMCFWGVDSADVLCVLMLDGWSSSIGVSAEIKHAEKQGKLIYELFPETVPGFVEYMKSWNDKNNSNI